MFHPRGPTFFELAQQALSSTERGYDLLAPKFDFTPFRTPDFVFEHVQSEIGEPGAFDAALDICCGTGAAMQMLRPLCRERVVGLDMSQGMLEVAEQNSADWPGEAEVQFVRGNALDEHFHEEFDVVVCFGALGHITASEQPQFLERIFESLKPGGRFCFVTGPMPPYWSLRYLLSRGFNAAMHVRNLLIRPPFIMFYLTFLLPGIVRDLEQTGFEVETRGELFEGVFKNYVLVVATRPVAEGAST